MILKYTLKPRMTAHLLRRRWKDATSLSGENSRHKNENMDIISQFPHEKQAHSTRLSIRNCLKEIPEQLGDHKPKLTGKFMRLRAHGLHFFTDHTSVNPILFDRLRAATFEEPLPRLYVDLKHQLNIF